MKPARSKKKVATRGNGGKERLLKSGLVLFGKVGYDGASIRDIARHAGVSLALNRKHFGSKAGLRTAVDEYVLQEFGSLLEKGSRMESLNDLVELAVEFARRDKEVFAYVRYALLDPRAGSQNLLDSYYRIHADLIDLLKKNGKLGEHVDLRWAPYFTMFLQMGPIVFGPYATKWLRASMYDQRIVRERNQAFMAFYEKGILKSLS